MSLDLASYKIRISCVGPGAIVDMDDRTEPSLILEGGILAQLNAPRR